VWIVRNRIIVLGATVTLFLAGCSDYATQRDKITTDTQMKTYQTNQPVPMFNYSQERDTMIQLYMMRNEARQTYTVVSSQGTGQTIFECPSRGTALAADTQLTNGLQAIGSGGPIEQAEPNGLYSSKNTDGTWILCVRKDGSIAPVYTENKVTQFPFAVRWNAEKRQYEDAEGASSMVVQIGAR
jgi:hypothetical protein